MMPASPYNLFQERYQSDPWRLLCCTIMLNVCSGRALERVHSNFFKAWPSAERVCLMDDIDRELMEYMLRPLGLQRVRVARIISMSRAYLTWNGQDASELPGIGKYGRDSHDMFCRGVIPHDVQDKELRRYIRWLTHEEGHLSDIGTDRSDARGDRADARVFSQEAALSVGIAAEEGKR